MSTRKRLIPLLCFSAITTAYLHRVVLSQAVIPLSMDQSWGQEKQGWLLASFFYGYILTQFPGAYLSQKFGSKFVVAVGLCISSLITLIIPFVATQSFPALIALRILTGVCQGVTFPSVTNLIGSWMNPSEYTGAIAFSWSGGHVGTALVQGLYPMMVEWAGDRWEFPFYCFGGIGFGWLAMWLIIVSSKPSITNSDDEIFDSITTTRSSYRTCQIEEENFHNILDDIPEDDNNDEKNNLEGYKHFKTVLASPNHHELESSLSAANIPTYSEIFRSPAAWAYFINHFSYNWTFYFLLTYLPKYLNYIVGVEFEKAGLLAVIPYIGLYLFSTGGGLLSDFMIRRGVKTIKVRKLFQSIGCLIPVITLSLIILLPTISQEVYLILIITTVSVSGIAVCGFATNPLDLMPHSSGILVGIGNTFATIPGMIAPALTGYLLKQGGCQDSFPEGETCVESWNMTFIISISLYLFGVTIWLLFASSKAIIT